MKSKIEGIQTQELFLWHGDGMLFQWLPLWSFFFDVINGCRDFCGPNLDSVVRNVPRHAIMYAMYG